MRRLSEVLAAHSAELMAQPDVVAVGEGECEGEPCIKVYVSKRAAVLDDSIPARLDGYRVVIELSGEIRAR